MGLSLLGWPLVIVLAVATLALSVLAVTGLARISVAGHSVSTPVRITALVLSQAMAIALVADVVNRQNAFYVSWGDLLGTSKITSVAYQHGKVPPLVSNPTQIRVTHNSHQTGHYHAASGSVIVGRTFHPWPKTAQVSKDVYGWTRVNTTLVGPLSHITGNISIHLPPGWTPNPARAYPVVEVLGGYPGSITKIFNQLGAGQVFEEAVNQHRYRPMIVVAVQDHGFHRDGECINTSAGLWGTWLAHDVPNWLTTHLAGTTDRTARVAVGFSMGGWCANMLSVKYPSVFASSISLGGYMQPSFDPPNPVKLSAAQRAQYNLPHILATNPPNIRMWVQTDALDKLSYPSEKLFIHKSVKAPASLMLVVTKGAGHNFRSVAYALPSALTWLGHVAPAFKR